MTAREGVEAPGLLDGVLAVIETALAEILKDPDGRDPAWEALWIGDELKPLLAVHDELVRADERKRLAEEDDVLYRGERAAARDILRRVRLTEEE